ncbi:MAG: hypothetical protein QOH73_2806 [Gaiellaceae bacterium]|nr:hypothetical protein [Gaiellaceae bacterium]
MVDSPSPCHPSRPGSGQPRGERRGLTEATRLRHELGPEGLSRRPLAARSHARLGCMTAALRSMLIAALWSAGPACPHLSRGSRRGCDGSFVDVPPFRAFPRGVTRVHQGDRRAGDTRLVADELAELVEHPRVQVAALRLLDRPPVTDPGQVFELDPEAGAFGCCDELLTDPAVAVARVAGFLAPVAFEQPPWRTSFPWPAIGRGAGRCNGELPARPCRCARCRQSRQPG